ncbi:uncharacterized protein LOC128554127 [Mercenaria mercenaria]|uniref:uncharacterized protein LOC128554127 n=1 Tax=Mercenaria mercenaria TaxID=6596 RepID=UPI00234F010C|nr:uncharacterized protein LOC128554127 [Mercenaria mercenaria]
MASVVFRISGVVLFAYLVPCILGNSRFCQVEHECTGNCYRRQKSSTNCGFLSWSECSKYSSQIYTCKFPCLKDVCCNGYTGTNCDIPISCNEADVLPDLIRRTRNYKANGDIAIDSWINDKNLGPGWFKVGNHTMPDSNTIPTYGHCGTKQPIYVQGNHTKTDLLNETPISMDVCEVSLSNDCLNPTTVDVRLCDDGLQYYLPETSDQSGYCFG